MVVGSGGGARRILRLNGLGMSGLEHRARRLRLLAVEPQDAGGKECRLQEAIATIRERFGDDAVQRRSDG